MKNKILALSLTAVTFSGIATAQENILPHAQEMPQRINLNPALRPDNNLFVTIPSLAISAENTGFCFDDLFTRGTDDTLRLDLGRLANNMRKTNFTSANVEFPILGFGKRMNNGNGFISFFLGNKTMVESKFDKDITDLWKGNWDYDNDQPINHHISDIFVRGMNYMEFSGGYSRRIPDMGMTFGARIKFLAGVFAVLSDDLKLDFDTERDNELDRYSVRVSSSGSIKTTLPVNPEINEDGYVEKLELDDIDLDNSNPIKNKGIAFDLGATWQINSQWKVGLSLVDLGFIKWNDGCHQFNAGSSFTFRGIDMNEDMKNTVGEEDVDESSYWENVKDSLMRFKDVSHTTTSFKTRLSSRLIATADYQPFDWLSAGATVATKFVDGQAFTRGSLTALLHAGKVLTFAGTAAINPGGRFSPGVGLIVTGGPMQLFMLADRMPHSLNKSTGLSLAFGINIVVGRKKYYLVKDAHKAEN